jgi:hypothetical protein
VTADPELPKAALPWANAAADYCVHVLSAMLLCSDWDKAQDAYDVMVAEQSRFSGAFAAASSGAATELDYYGQEDQ